MSGTCCMIKSCCWHLTLHPDPASRYGLALYGFCEMENTRWIFLQHHGPAMYDNSANIMAHVRQHYIIHIIYRNVYMGRHFSVPECQLYSSIGGVVRAMYRLIVQNTMLFGLQHNHKCVMHSIQVHTGTHKWRSLCAGWCGIENMRISSVGGVVTRASGERNLSIVHKAYNVTSSHRHHQPHRSVVVGHISQTPSSSSNNNNIASTTGTRPPLFTLSLRFYL